MASPADFREWLRTELPRLLREDPSLRSELQATFQEVFPTRGEIEELRALRQDFNLFAEEMSRRFEEINRRFETVDRRFETVIGELRAQRLHLSRLSGRLGYGLEHLVRGVVEEFAGRTLERAERLILRDPDGEVFGVPADIEFDLFASDGEAYLCEVKSHIEPDDVLTFHRKATFAARHLTRPFVQLMIGASMESAADRLMKSLGIRSIVRARVDRDDTVTAL